MSTRETLIGALFDLLNASHDYKTSGRRLMLWNLVNEQPAMFLRHVGDEFPPRPTGLLSRTMIECEAWIYAKSADSWLGARSRDERVAGQNRDGAEAGAGAGGADLGRPRHALLD
jgi:hypothetical protein